MKTHVPDENSWEGFLIKVKALLPAEKVLTQKQYGLIMQAYIHGKPIKLLMKELI